MKTTKRRLMSANSEESARPGYFTAMVNPVSPTPMLSPVMDGVRKEI